VVAVLGSTAADEADTPVAGSTAVVARGWSGGAVSALGAPACEGTGVGGRVGLQVEDKPVVMGTPGAVVELVGDRYAVAGQVQLPAVRRTALREVAGGSGSLSTPPGVSVHISHFTVFLRNTAHPVIPCEVTESRLHSCLNVMSGPCDGACAAERASATRSAQGDGAESQGQTHLYFLSGRWLMGGLYQ
jgi:hypothetical protein